MKKLWMVFVAILWIVRAQAQDELPQKVVYDFDGDGKEDVFQIGEGYLSYALSSQKEKEVRSKGAGYSDQTWLELVKNVVVYQCQFNRGQNTFKFRYDPKLGQFKLIGYDNDQFGNAVNDGSGSVSYNLLTGSYIAQWFYFDHKKEILIRKPEIRKKLLVKPYLFTDFGDAMIDQLYEMDASFDK